MRIRSIENALLFAQWALQNYPEDWAYEIMNRFRDDAFPPYEFWRALPHRNEQKMIGMVARGIARWIEQQHEYRQDFVLALLDVDIHTSEADMKTRFDVACMSIWSDMKAYEWLQRHAYDCDHKSPIWRQAVVLIICHIKGDTWHELRNYKPQFFIEGKAYE